MQKVYTYEPKEYFRQITFIGIFTCLIILACIYMALTADLYPGFWGFVALIAFYSSWNTFIARANSSEVILEEDGITFVAYGRKDKYLFTEITHFLAKDFRSSGKIFIRINKPSLLKGRYWLHTLRFNDGQELYLFILKLEYKANPTGLKARAWDSTRPNMDKTPILPWNMSEEQKMAELGIKPKTQSQQITDKNK